MNDGSIRRSVGSLVAMAAKAAMVGLLVGFVSPPTSAGAAAGTVDIRVTMNIYGVTGPVVFERDNVTPGPGVELDASNVTSNPTPLPGSVTVDIDPTAQTITIAPDDWHGTFNTAEVTITGGQYQDLTTVQDELWDPTNPPAHMNLTSASASVAAGVDIVWTSAGGNVVSLNPIGQTSVFHYDLAVTPTSAPPATVSTPTTVAPHAAPAPAVVARPGFTG